MAPPHKAAATAAANVKPARIAAATVRAAKVAAAAAMAAVVADVAATRTNDTTNGLFRPCGVEKSPYVDTDGFSTPSSENILRTKQINEYLILSYLHSITS